MYLAREGEAEEKKKKTLFNMAIVEVSILSQVIELVR